jgi:flagellar biosynthesis protein FlhF
MAKVREELGPDAIILHVEDSKTGKGVRIRAAAETSDAQSAAETRAAPGSAEHIETRLEHDLRARLRVFQPSRDTGERIDPQTDIAPALQFHRTPGELTGRLLRIAGEAATSAPEAALAHALDRAIGCAPLPLKPARPVVAIGAPGHGKSTALARLAAQSAALGHPVVMITLDTGKAGAVAQIETYGALLKARVETCGDETQLQKLIEDCPGGAAIFVDTPGVNLWSADDAASARRWIGDARGEAVWIVSAETDADTMIEAAGWARSLGARRMIATKLDVARRFGGVAAAAAQGPIALAGLIVSPFLADGIETPNPANFARRLLETARAADPKPAFQEARTA